MAFETTSEILALFGALKARRINFETQWQDIADFMLGRYDFITQNVTQGRQRQPIIYDNTGNHAGDVLAAALHNFLTNTATRWFALEPEETELKRNREAMAWFEQAESISREVIQRAASRFVPQMHECWLQLVYFNTAALMVESVLEGPSPLRFSTRPLREIYVSEDAAGRIDTVFRKHRMTHRQALQDFPETAPQAIREQAASHPEQESEYLQLIHPRRDPVLGAMGQPGMPWRTVHLSETHREIIREGGFWEQPLLVARWEKDAGEVYGRGPGLHALPDCKQANLQVKTLLKAGQKIADPPLQVADDGVINPLNTSPGGVNVVRANAFSGDVIKPLPIEPNVPITLELIQETRLAIRAHFKFDLLQLLQHRPGTTPITATQSLEIVEGAQTLIAPQLARLQVELLEPLITRVFGILARRGFFPEAPDFLRGRPVKVRYISPVERAQRSSESRSLVQSLGIVGQIAELDPEVIDNVDLDVAARLAVEANDTPSAVLRNRQAVRRRRRARAELARQEAAQAQQVQEAETLRTLSQAGAA